LGCDDIHGCRTRFDRAATLFHHAPLGGPEIKAGTMILCAEDLDACGFFRLDTLLLCLWN
jgi:hypothetical protein